MRLIPVLAVFALGVVTTLVTAATLQQAPAAQSDIEFIGVGRNLSSVVRVGNTLYLSGQLGLRGERGIEPETRATMESIKSLLEANGATMDDVVKCTVFLGDFGDFNAMNAVYAPYFEKHRPARSTVAVAGMFGDAAVEIECMAVIGARNATSS
ncbi:MAG TPA: Rid family hydrolase [Longimicrobiales bacterium]|nr:Rid family hydrolase [Longimicrobiales bacterium]